MSRCSNWPTKLVEFIAGRQDSAFAWDANNCCFFACDWIVILTGIDPADPYRARVTSALTAIRLLEGEGTVETVAQAVCARHGWAEVSPLFAQRGDVVLIDTQDGPAIGVCGGSIVYCPGPRGLSTIETRCGRRAWRIE